MKWYNNLSKEIRALIMLAITFLLGGAIGYVLIEAEYPGNPKLTMIVELSVFAILYLLAIIIVIIKKYKK